MAKDETIIEFIQREMQERNISPSDPEAGEMLWSALASVLIVDQYEPTEGDIRFFMLFDIFNRFYAIRRRYQKEYAETLQDEGLRQSVLENIEAHADATARLVVTDNIMTFYTVCYELADGLMEEILPSHIVSSKYADLPAVRDVFEGQGFHEKANLLRAIEVTDKPTHKGILRIGDVRGDLVHDIESRFSVSDIENFDDELLESVKAVNSLYEMKYGISVFQFPDE